MLDDSAASVDGDADICLRDRVDDVASINGQHGVASRLDDPVSTGTTTVAEYEVSDRPIGVERDGTKRSRDVVGEVGRIVKATGNSTPGPIRRVAPQTA